MVRAIKQALLIALASAVLVGALPATIFGNCLAAIKCESRCPQHRAPKPEIPTCCDKEEPKEKTPPKSHLCVCFKAESGVKALPAPFLPKFDFPTIPAQRPEVAGVQPIFSAVVPILVRNHGPPRSAIHDSHSPRAPPIQ